MTHHGVRVNWNRENHNFTDKHYSREHTWTFDGGLQIPASSSPYFVPPPYSQAFNVDPEEALIAAVSSGHMLRFLSLAAKRGFCVDSYRDQARGFLEKNQQNHWTIKRINLKPQALFSGTKLPSVADIITLHQLAQQECFIANSIKAEINCEPLIYIKTVRLPCF